MLWRFANGMDTSPVENKDYEMLDKSCGHGMVTEYGLAIVLDTVAYPPEEVEQYAVLTASFGEFIGLKDCAYIDVNNCPFADQLLAQGIAESTPYTKQSGFCTYPLWHFNGDFLKDIGASNYEKYSAGYKYENDEGDNESYIDDGDEGMALS